MKKISVILFLIGIFILVIDVLCVLVYALIWQPLPHEKLPLILTLPSIIAIVLIFFYLICIVIQQRKVLWKYIKNAIKTGNLNL